MLNPLIIGLGCWLLWIYLVTRPRFERGWPVGSLLLAVLLPSLVWGAGAALWLAATVAVAGVMVWRGYAGRTVFIQSVFYSVSILLSSMIVNAIFPIVETSLLGRVLMALVAWAVPFLLAYGQQRRWVPLLLAGQELTLALLAVAVTLAADAAGTTFMLLLGALLISMLLVWYQRQYLLSRDSAGLQWLAEVLQQSGAADSPQAARDHIVQSVLRYADLSALYVVCYDAPAGCLRFPVVIEQGQPQQWPDYRLNDPFPLTLSKVHWRAGDTLPSGSLYSSLPSVPYSSYLGLPLIADGVPVGILGMARTTDAPFTADEIRLLELAASHLAIVLKHSVQSMCEAMLNAHLATVNEAIQQMQLNNNVALALETACELALTVTGGQRSAILVTNESDPEHLYLKAHTGLSERFIAYLNANPQPLVLQNAIVSDITQADTLSADLQVLASAGAFKAYISIPMYVNQTLQGAFGVYYDEVHTFYSYEVTAFHVLVNHISSLLENARLFDIMEHYAYEMSELIQLARISTASMDMDAVMHDIADMLQQMTGASRVEIITVEDEQLRQLVAFGGQQTSAAAIDESVYQGFFSEFEALQASPRPFTRAYQRSDTEVSDTLRMHMQQHQEQAVALVPLLVENELLGVVLLGLQEMRQFEAHDWRFAEMAANQIAAQIRNVRLHESTQQELHRRLRQVSLIEKIAHQVSSSLDLDMILDSVLEAAINATGADLASIGLVSDADPHRVRFIEHRYDKEKLSKREFWFRRNEGLAGVVLANGQVVNAADNQDMPEYASAFNVYRSSLLVPLLSDKQVVGALNVESTRLAAFNSNHADFLTNLASHAVISIQNARFLEERQYEIDMLRSLRELSLWLVQADNTRAAGHEILETALQLLGGQNGIIYEYNNAQGRLRPLVRIWYSQQLNDYAQVVLPEVVARQVITQQSLVMFEDITRHDRYDPQAHYNYEAVLAFPLKRARHILYCVLITFENHRRLMDRDFHIVDLLSSQALGHLENAGLHERIRQGRDQMQAILNSTRDGLILLDSTAHVIEANISASQLLGLDFRAQLGASFASIMTGAQEGYSPGVVNALLDLLHERPHEETRRAFEYRQNNQRLYLEEIGLPVRDDSNQIVGRLLVLRDVTAAMLLEEQREDLTDMVVHDLRGPLGGIINAMKLALRMLDDPEDRADVEKLLDGASFSAGRLLGLVNTLLDISKMQNHGMALECEPVAVNALIEVAFTSVAGIVPEAGIDLRFDIPTDLPLVNVDGEKIERVLINLLDNALRYTPFGGEILVSARLCKNGNWVRVCIADSGPGIPPERRAAVFQRFQRIPGQSPRRGHRGHGLGLTFTRLAIEAHGGTITVTDHETLSGACFIFTLPVFSTDLSLPE